ncbi:MAG: LacI family DNA-binding transcriptional regulator [Proteobacteria bacterium]|nr:LacI family DNA-binding transcriptional regulator [Pseudomonadota bacterium]
MTRRTPVGIRDIGDALGLSMMSVSRALRGVEGVSAGTRIEVIQAAKRMGYRPNRNARSLASAHSTLIGVSIPSLFSDVFPEILDGMRATFDHAGFDTLIDTTHYNTAREADWAERMLDWNAAALVLCGVDHEPDLRRRLRDLRIPTLEFWDTTDDPIDVCVGIDHWKAGADLAEHLLACGYTRPAFIGVPEGRDTRADKRLAGLVATYASAGIDAVDVRRIDHRATFEAGALATESLLAAEGPRPDVLAYLNDHMAFGGLSTCMRLGLSIPDAIGIAGFNDLEINKILPMPITTIITPRTRMGEIGARNIIARIKGAVVERCVTIPTELRIGHTTRAPLSSGGPFSSN